MVESDTTQNAFEVSLSETIISILISKNKAFSSHEIYEILGNKNRKMDEITNELELLIKRNPFIKKRKREGTLDEEYYMELHSSVQKFINNLSVKTKKILDANTYKTLNERTEILKSNGFSLDEMLKCFPIQNGKSISKESLRRYIMALSELGYLKNNGYSGYYFDYDYLESIKDIDKVIELEQFWNSALNFPNIIDINFHGIQAKSHKKLKSDYSKMDESNGWTDKGNFKEKRIPFALGTLTIICYSNKENQMEHLFNIHYEGSLLCYNSEKRKIRGKFSVQKNDFEILFAQIKQILYELYYNKEIEFNESEFDNFLLYNLGYNIDIEDEITQKKIRKSFPEFYFSKAVSTRDFSNNYSLRAYRFYDKFTEKNMMRILDAHTSNPNEYTIKGMLDVLNYTGEQMINEKIMSARILDETKALIQGYKTIQKSNKSIMEFISRKAIEQIQMNQRNQDLIIKSSELIITQIEKEKNRISHELNSIRETTNHKLMEIAEKIEGDILTSEISLTSEIDEVGTKINQIYHNNGDILTEIQKINKNQNDHAKNLELMINALNQKDEKLEDNIHAITENLIQNQSLFKNISKSIQIIEKYISLKEKGIFFKLKKIFKRN